jgi:hypothetical protein
MSELAQPLGLAVDDSSTEGAFLRALIGYAEYPVDTAEISPNRAMVVAKVAA